MSDYAVQAKTLHESIEGTTARTHHKFFSTCEGCQMLHTALNEAWAEGSYARPTAEKELQQAEVSNKDLHERIASLVDRNTKLRKLIDNTLGITPTQRQAEMGAEDGAGLDGAVRLLIKRYEAKK